MLTAAQICSEARGIAKTTGWTTKSGTGLNLVLDDLVQHHDLKINRVTVAVSVTGGTNGPFNLQSDYLRTYDLFYLQADLPFFLKPVSMEQYDALIKDPAISNYPFLFTTDLAPLALDPAAGIPLLYVYPQSDGTIELTHRYMIRRAQITSPEVSATVPWFPDQLYLIKATALYLMLTTDDSRQAEFQTACESMLRQHLIMGDGDEAGVVKSIALDPLRFRSNRRLRPTKTQPW